MVTLTIEIENGSAYISDNIGGTGIECYGNTAEELTKNIAFYVEDYVYDEMNDTDEDDE